MNKQTFEIIDGVYEGPEVWKGELDLQYYKDTLTSLGPLKKVKGYLDLDGCTSLVSLGSLKEVGDWSFFAGCTSLTSLGSLKEVGGNVFLEGCTSLVSLGSLKEVKGCVSLEGCTSLTSLCSLKKIGDGLYLNGCTSLVTLGDLTNVRGSLYVEFLNFTLQEVQEKIRYYSSLPLHEALNALHTYEVQDVPLYKNILLKSLQGGGIPSLCVCKSLKL